MRLVMSEHESVRAGRTRTSLATSLRLRLLARWLYPLADAVVAVSHGIGDELRAEHGSRAPSIMVISNAVLTPQFEAGLQAPPPHPWLADHSTPVIVAIGRLVELKGFDTLLDAFALARAVTNARLVILGDGPLRDTLESHADTLGLRDAVHFAGFQPAPAAWLRHSAMLVLASRSEGLPTVLIEALGSGTRIVSTDCDFGPSQILEQGRWGTLVPVGDADAMAKGIVAQLGRPRMVVPEHVLEQYRTREVTARYRNLLLGSERQQPAPSPSKRVLHFISGLTTGGAETALLRAVEATSPLGWSHTVVSLTGEGSRAAPLRAAGATVHALDLRRVRTWWRGVRALRALAGDAAIVHGWMYHGNLAATVATLGRHRCRLMWSVRSSLDTLTSTSIGRRAVMRAGALCSSRAEAIVYNSLRSAEQHEQFGFAPAGRRFIPNGFEVDRLLPSAAMRDRRRTEWQFDDGLLLVGMFARVAPEKDHTTFLRAMIDVCERAPNVRILLAGRGTDCDHALGPLIRSEALRGRLIRLGDCQDVATLYPACDITVLSSRREGFPNVVAESMACAVPCVVTDVGDAATVVGDTGIVVSPASPDALADAVRQLLQESPVQRSARAQRARERVVTHFGADRMRDAYIDLWTNRAASAAQTAATSSQQEVA